MQGAGRWALGAGQGGAKPEGGKRVPGPQGIHRWTASRQTVTPATHLGQSEAPIQAHHGALPPAASSEKGDALDTGCCGSSRGTGSPGLWW